MTAPELEPVAPAEKRTVARVALVYLARHGDAWCRFDVVGITGEDVVHLPDAFRVSG